MADLFEKYARCAAEAFAAANREDEFHRAMEFRREAYRYVDLLQALREQALARRGETD